MKTCSGCGRSFSEASVFAPDEVPYHARGPICMGCDGDRRASYEQYQRSKRGGETRGE